MYGSTRFLELYHWISTVVNLGKGSLGSFAISPSRPFPPFPSPPLPPLQSWIQHRCVKRRLQDLQFHLGRSISNTNLLQWVNDDENLPLSSLPSFLSFPFFPDFFPFPRFLSRLRGLRLSSDDSLEYWKQVGRHETSHCCFRVNTSGSLISDSLYN